MAESNARTPLLSDIDENNEDSTCQAIIRNGRNNESITELSPVLCSFAPAIDNTSSFLKDVDPSSPDVICVFVVAFDTRAGNIIEYCVPDDIDLDGIEFKAMASGSHNITYDFTYFKKGKWYGLSCFENMPVDSQIERGARMKSVGILASSYLHLHCYKKFLEQQVSILLKLPGHYDNLDEFYAKKKGVLTCSSSAEGSSPVVLEQILNPSNSFPLLKIMHPAGCFSQFTRFFGPQIFLLWKYALLKKRLLFFSPPPIGVVCYRVYCTNYLTSHQVGEILPAGANVLFYVNVADVDMLETADNYIACTTEKILEGKSHLYDIYIVNQRVCAQSTTMKAITLTTADKSNFNKLTNQQRELLPGSNYGGTNDEATFIKFFANLNNKLFGTLLDASHTQDKLLTTDQIRNMGLDPSGDRQFLTEVISSYTIDVHLVPDSPCC